MVASWLLQFHRKSIYYTLSRSVVPLLRVGDLLGSVRYQFHYYKHILHMIIMSKSVRLQVLLDELEKEKLTRLGGFGSNGRSRSPTD